MCIRDSSQIDALADVLDIAKPTERRVISSPAYPREGAPGTPGTRESHAPGTVATAKTTPVLTPAMWRAAATEAVAAHAPPIATPPATTPPATTPPATSPPIT